MIELKPIKKNIDEKDILRGITFFDDDIVFISGSLVEGIGNKKSDLDIFVITNKFEDISKCTEIIYDNEYIKTTFKNELGFGLDIEYWPYETVLTMFQQIDKINFEDIHSRATNFLKIKGYDFLALSSFIHRFVVGKPLFNAGEFNKLYMSLNINNYCRLMVRYYINLVDNCYDDIIGNLENKEYETAYISAQEAIWITIMAYLFTKKSSIDNKKWAFQKLRHLSLTNKEASFILGQLERTVFYNNISEDNLGEVIENCIRFINETINIIGEKEGI